jgi:hypothetical protein
MTKRRLGPLEAIVTGGSDRAGGGTGPVVVPLHGFGARPTCPTASRPRAQVIERFDAVDLEIAPGSRVVLGGDLHFGNRRRRRVPGANAGAT